MKLPRNPGALTIAEADLFDLPSSLLWRVHYTAGEYATPWFALRRHGPTANRFDPHPPPPGVHDDFGVQYTAGDVDTALAEVFQAVRQISAAVPNEPCLTAWRPTRRLRLLDLRGQWPIRNGAAHSLNTGPHATCRRWAHAIAEHQVAADGLLYTSAMTGNWCAALFLPAEDSFPRLPEFSRLLRSPGMAGLLEPAARRIGYRYR